MLFSLIISFVSLSYAETTDETEPSSKANTSSNTNTKYRVGACSGFSSECFVLGLEMDVRDYRTHFQAKFRLNPISLSSSVAYRFNSEPKTYEPYISVSSVNLFGDATLPLGLSIGGSAEFGDSSVFVDLSLSAWKWFGDPDLGELILPGASLSVSYGF